MNTTTMLSNFYITLYNLTSKVSRFFPHFDFFCIDFLFYNDANATPSKEREEGRNLASFDLK